MELHIPQVMVEQIAPILCYQECWCLRIPEHRFFQLFLGINKSQLRAGECTLADLQLNGGSCSVQWVLTPLGDRHKLSTTT